MPKNRPDPLERAIELALEPGRFVPDRASFSFIPPLEEVEAGIRALIRTSAKRAVSLYETFLAACHEKAEELDDSSGQFGEFVGTLFAGWVKARPGAGADPDETATRLLAWMDDDPYGYLSQLDDELVAALDRAGLAAFERRVRARFDGTVPPPPAASEFTRDPKYQRRRWGAKLRAILARRRDAAGYAKLCDETELTARDCLALAKMHLARRAPEEALGWVRRGLKIAKRDRASVGENELVQMERDLLRKLGRGKEALASAWAAFKNQPSTYGYRDLMKEVPRREAAPWRHKAMEAAEKSRGLYFVVELFLEEQETDRLVRPLRAVSDKDLDDLGHHFGEQAAERVAKKHPDVAAKVYRALGLRILERKKSRYYGAALLHFENAKRCYERAGLGAEWKKVVAKVRAEHHRKTGFIAGFGEVVAGGGARQEPGFIERARARWMRPRT